MLYFGSLLQVRQIIFLPFASVLVFLMLWWNNMAQSNLERSGFISLYTSRQHFMDRQEPMLCRNLEAGVMQRSWRSAAYSLDPHRLLSLLSFLKKNNYCFSRPIKVSPRSLPPLLPVPPFNYPPCPHPLLIFLPKKTGLPCISVSPSILSCSKTRHLLSIEAVWELLPTPIVISRLHPATDGNRCRDL